VLIVSNKPNPLKDNKFIKKYFKKKVKNNTKRLWNKKKMLHIVTILIWCYQIYGNPKTYIKTPLRVIVAMIIAMAKIYHIRNLYLINTAKIKFYS
jgi:hypothetical protein